MSSSNFGKIIASTITAAFAGKATSMLKNEVEFAKEEVKLKAKGLAVGVGLMVAAAVFAFFALLVLIAAAVAGLSEAWPVWLSALTIGGGILLIAVILVAIGNAKIKKNKDLKPERAIKSVKSYFGV